MTKPEFVAAMSKCRTFSDLPKCRLEDMYDALFLRDGVVAKAIVNTHGEAKLGELGVLKFRATAARIGRNPATGGQIQIPAKHKIVFTPSKTLKDLVNQ